MNPIPASATTPTTMAPYLARWRTDWTVRVPWRRSVRILSSMSLRVSSI
jgi:hypothetical protein